MRAGGAQASGLLRHRGLNSLPSGMEKRRGPLPIIRVLRTTYRWARRLSHLSPLPHPHPTLLHSSIRPNCSTHSQAFLRTCQPVLGLRCWAGSNSEQVRIWDLEEGWGKRQRFLQVIGPRSTPIGDGCSPHLYLCRVTGATF